MSLLPGWSFRYRLWVAYCGVKLISWLRIDDYCNVCCLVYFYLFGFSSHIFTRFLKGILEELSSCRFSSQSKINKCFFFFFGLIFHFCDGNRNIVSDILGRVWPKLICRLRYFPFNITHSANFWNKILKFLKMFFWFCIRTPLMKNNK